MFWQGKCDGSLLTTRGNESTDDIATSGSTKRVNTILLSSSNSSDHLDC